MKFIKIDEQSKFLLTAVLMGLLLFPNGFYLFLPVATIYLALYILQQPYKPAVFSLVAIQHFLQIIAGVWLCNYLGKDIDYNTLSRSTATIAACFGLLFLLAPILYFQSRLPAQSFGSLRNFTNNLSTQKIINAYLISFFLSTTFGALAFFFTGLTQLLVSLVKIRWLLFLLLGFQCFFKNEKKNIFYVFVLLEFLSGLISFFSDFKTVIYFLVILLFSFIEKLDFKQVFYVIVIGFLLGTAGLYWTQIKGDYRSYLNGGSINQSVNVEKSDALDKLYDLSSKVDNSKLDASAIQLLDRLQYTYHFAKTIDRMPSILPFENGANWLRSLEFTTTPRFLNPDKPNYDATTKTKYYTGLSYLGSDHGVSFSLGYFADCYIDFGLYGMMLMLITVGTLYGLMYNYFLKNSSKNLVFNYAVVGAFFMEFNALELDSTYLLGRLFSSFITFFLLIRFFFPWLIRYLSVDQQKGKK